MGVSLLEFDLIGANLRSLLPQLGSGWVKLLLENFVFMEPWIVITIPWSVNGPFHWSELCVPFGNNGVT